MIPNLPPDATDSARQRNLLWLFACLHDTRDSVIVKTDKVGYLMMELSTVQEIISQSVCIQETLGLDKIAVVADQALYAKATKVVWKQCQRFESIQLMMGNFHIICDMLSIIGKLF